MDGIFGSSGLILVALVSCWVSLHSGCHGMGIWEKGVGVTISITSRRRPSSLSGMSRSGAIFPCHDSFCSLSMYCPADKQKNATCLSNLTSILVLRRRP